MVVYALARGDRRVDALPSTLGSLCVKLSYNTRASTSTVISRDLKRGRRGRDKAKPQKKTRVVMGVTRRRSECGERAYRIDQRSITSPIGSLAIAQSRGPVVVGWAPWPDVGEGSCAPRKTAAGAAAL